MPPKGCKKGLELKDSNKLATNIDEQMDLLKSRGMTFENFSEKLA
jgi:hypothetical protein